MFFKNFKVWETELAGRKLTLETGKMAGLANASIMALQSHVRALTSSLFRLTMRKKCMR